MSLACSRERPFSFAQRAGNPSSVVISCFAVNVEIGVTQERTSLPSMRTEQAPHCASPQPNCGPLSCRSLRKTYSKGVSSLARSEEHTSELQSHSDLVCRLL